MESLDALFAQTDEQAKASLLAHHKLIAELECREAQNGRMLLFGP